MPYFEFREHFISWGYFYTDQVLAAIPDFDLNTLERWSRFGQIVKLRHNFYALKECVEKPNSTLYLSNFMYRSSYVSLQSALEFHGIIPVGTVKEITAVSTIKTTAFRNDVGVFVYKKIKPCLMFGYEQHPFGNSGNRWFSIAKPEKALLDMFYVYLPNTPQEITDMQIDGNFIHNKINSDTMLQMTKFYDSKALLKRLEMFRKIYGI